MSLVITTGTELLCLNCNYLISRVVHVFQVVVLSERFIYDVVRTHHYQTSHVKYLQNEYS